MKPVWIALIALLAAAAAAADPDTAETPPDRWRTAPLFDLRVRQEVLDGVYHFAPEPDRDWLRVRTRAGLRFTRPGQRFEFRLANEHRHYLDPEQRGSLDELILDRALWAWQAEAGLTLTVGRQDLIWPGGFLMLEGHPLDGSRSIYQNAVRLELERSWGLLDVALIRNAKRDGLVLTGDQERDLSWAEELALAVRYARGRWQAGLVWKDEHDPDGLAADLTTLTGWGRHDGRLGRGVELTADLALQVQDPGDLPGVADAADRGLALAGQAACHGTTAGLGLEAGGFYYSGEGEDRRAFRAPWGDWPKWSELYIYTLIAESTPGRVHVAAWENIAAWRAAVSRPLGGRLTARLEGVRLLALEPETLTRGHLLRSGLEADLGRGLRGHLLWEMFDPGEFHDGSNGLPPLTRTAHFLRWQLEFAIK